MSNLFRTTKHNEENSDESDKNETYKYTLCSSRYAASFYSEFVLIELSLNQAANDAIEWSIRTTISIHILRSSPWMYGT